MWEKILQRTSGQPLTISRTQMWVVFSLREYRLGQKIEYFLNCEHQVWNANLEKAAEESSLHVFPQEMWWKALETHKFLQGTYQYPPIVTLSTAMQIILIQERQGPKLLSEKLQIHEEEEKHLNSLK